MSTSEFTEAKSMVINNIWLFHAGISLHGQFH